jgi:hypothetical protein
VVAERFNLHIRGETISKKEQVLGSNTDGPKAEQADDSLNKTRKLLRTSPSRSVAAPLNHKEIDKVPSGHRDSDRAGLEKLTVSRSKPLPIERSFSLPCT